MKKTSIPEVRKPNWANGLVIFLSVALDALVGSCYPDALKRTLLLNQLSGEDFTMPVYETLTAEAFTPNWKGE
ncbi:MAG: hypothetical protein MK138_14950, partial [Planctomycetes bacterium]|nr:hypothetical protein [Planctomycetota bacterium]